MFSGRVMPSTRTDLPQIPEIVNPSKEMTEVFLGRLGLHMERSEFVAGPRLEEWGRSEVSHLEREVSL